jgi:hypothetical protein
MKTDETNVVSGTVVASQEMIEKQKLDRDEERAKRKLAAKLVELKQRQKARANAPDGIAVDAILDEDPWDTLVRLHVPESIAKPHERGTVVKQYDYKPGATMDVRGDIAEHHKKNIDEGWIPVRDSEKGEHVSLNELFMYKRDMELTRERMYNHSRRAQAMMTAKDSAMAEAQKGGGGNVLEDVTTIQKRKLGG